jgi:hypothetical protein
MMSPNRHITRAIAHYLHLRVRHALPIARNSSTRKANRSRMTEHVNQKAQLIVRDTALALRTSTARAGRPSPDARFASQGKAEACRRKCVTVARRP